MRGTNRVFIQLVNDDDMELNIFTEFRPPEVMYSTLHILRVALGKNRNRAHVDKICVITRCSIGNKEQQEME